MNNYVLFLDDEREPSVSLLAQYERVVICRSFDDAVRVVQELGLPEHTCFDHDLGPESKNGHDFAKWLVEWVMDDDRFEYPPHVGYSVHSQNPIGADNIRGVIDGYHRWCIEGLKL